MFQTLANTDVSLIRELESIIKTRVKNGEKRDDCIHQMFGYDNQRLLGDRKRVRMFLDTEPAKMQRLAVVEKEIIRRRELERAFKSLVIPIKSDSVTRHLLDHPKYKTKKLAKLANGETLTLPGHYYEHFGMVAYSKRERKGYHMITGKTMKLNEYSSIVGCVGDKVLIEYRYVEADNIHVWDGTYDSHIENHVIYLESVNKKDVLVNKNGTISVYGVFEEGVMLNKVFKLERFPSYHHPVFDLRDDGVLVCNNVKWDLNYFDKIRVFEVLSEWLPVLDLQKKIFTYLTNG